MVLWENLLFRVVHLLISKHFIKNDMIIFTGIGHRKSVFTEKSLK